MTVATNDNLQDSMLMRESFRQNATCFVIKRRAYDQESFDTDYEPMKPSPKQGLIATAKAEVGKVCSCQRVRRLVIETFPILDWLHHYDIKRNLLDDVVAGVTVAIFQIPQAMAYGALAGVQPVYGLYTSFFPTFIYALMTTAHHNAVGTYSISSLMAAAILSKLHQPTSNKGGVSEVLPSHIGTVSSTSVSPLADASSVDRTAELMMTVCFVVGVYQMLFGVLRLGSLAVYLSDPLVSGFTCGTAVLVATSQLNDVLGIGVCANNGPLGIVWTYSSLFHNIGDTNMVSLGLSASAFFLLLFTKECMDPIFKAKCRIPVPTELILVIASTLLSHYLDLEHRYKIAVVGSIPTGLPPPRLPDFGMFPQMAVGCFSLAIVSYSATLSMAKLTAMKQNYVIDANQEAVALGAANVFGGFFSSIPCAASFTRTCLQGSLGGKTQVVSLVNCVVVLLVLLVVGPFLAQLPKCILSAVILVALKSLLLLILKFREYWRISKFDGLMWGVSFFGVVILNVDIGLGVGVAFAIITLLWRTQRPKTHLLGSVDSSDIYVPLKCYAKATEIPGIKIFSSVGPLHFANAEYYHRELERRTEVCVREIANTKSGNEPMHFTNHAVSEELAWDSKSILVSNCVHKSWETLDIASMQCDAMPPGLQSCILPTHIILDMSAITYVDSPGVAMLKRIKQEYDSIGVTVFLASCQENVTKVLRKGGFFDVSPTSHVFLTIHDAVVHIFLLRAQPLSKCSNVLDDVSTHL